MARKRPEVCPSPVLCNRCPRKEDSVCPGPGGHPVHDIEPETANIERPDLKSPQVQVVLIRSLARLPRRVKHQGD